MSDVPATRYAEIEGRFAVGVKWPVGESRESVARRIELEIEQVVMNTDPLATIHAAVITVNGKEVEK